MRQLQHTLPTGSHMNWTQNAIVDARASTRYNSLPLGRRSPHPNLITRLCLG